MTKAWIEEFEKTMLEWERSESGNIGILEMSDQCLFDNAYSKELYMEGKVLIRQQKEFITQLMKELEAVRLQQQETKDKIENAYRGNVRILKEAMRCIQKKNHYQRILQEIKEGSSLEDAEKKVTEADPFLNAWDEAGKWKEGEESFL